MYRTIFCRMATDKLFGISGNHEKFQSCMVYSRKLYQLCLM